MSRLHLSANTVSSLVLMLLACELCFAQLPPQARVGIWRINAKAPTPSAASVLVPGEFRADLMGQGQIRKVVFYTLPNPMANCNDCRASWMDVIDQEGITQWRYVVTWPRSQGVATAEFYEPTGIHRLLAGAPPLIVSFAYVGASGGGLLNILRWTPQGVEDVSGPWNQVEQVDDVRFEDLDGDGNEEVIILHTTINSSTRFGPRSVYGWNGKRYERRDSLPWPQKE